MVHRPCLFNYPSAMLLSQTRTNSLTRLAAVSLWLIAFGNLVSGCGPNAVYQGRTVDLPSREPIPLPSSTNPVLWLPTTGGTITNFDKPFYFTDPRPRVLVLGHVRVLQGGVPVEQLGEQELGALSFAADEFESNFGFWDHFVGYEAVTFVSGNWFSGHIYAGNRRLSSVYFTDDKEDPIRSFGFGGCGSNIFRFPSWEPLFNFDDNTKAYYLGHITFNIVPFRYWSWGSGRLEVTVRDLSDQYAGELRALVGDQDLALAIFPSCSE